jgi:hypothetical protein
MAGPDFIYGIYMALTLGFSSGLLYSFFFDWIALS